MSLSSAEAGTVIGRYTERSYYSGSSCYCNLPLGVLGEFGILRMGVGQLCACSCEVLVAASVIRRITHAKHSCSISAE